MMPNAIVEALRDYKTACEKYAPIEDLHVKRKKLFQLFDTLEAVERNAKKQRGQKV